MVAWRDSGDDEPASGGDELRPSSEVTLIAGRVDTLNLVPARLDPLRGAVTVEAEERGAASAQITAASVDGKSETVVWGGGTPLVLDPGGGDGSTPEGVLGLELEPAPVEAGPAGLVIRLGGVRGRLAPGTYIMTGSVAVGTGGLAASKDTLTFVATADTTVTFAGSAIIRRPPAAVTLSGPGTVHLVGDVELTGATADERAAIIEATAVPFLFDLVWVGERIEVDGRIEGTLSLTPAAEPEVPEPVGPPTPG